LCVQATIEPHGLNNTVYSLIVLEPGSPWSMGQWVWLQVRPLILVWSWLPFWCLHMACFLCVHRMKWPVCVCVCVCMRERESYFFPYKTTSPIGLWRHHYLKPYFTLIVSLWDVPQGKAILSKASKYELCCFL
jgi:hypothetical protein